MGIYNIFIVSKSGGLIYHYDHNIPQRETEKTFSYPLDIKLELDGKRVTVVFGERDGIKIGHTLLRLVQNLVLVGGCLNTPLTLYCTLVFNFVL